jgi:flagellar hook-length control protein FliK
MSTVEKIPLTTSSCMNQHEIAVQPKKTEDEQDDCETRSESVEGGMPVFLITLNNTMDRSIQAEASTANDEQVAVELNQVQTISTASVENGSPLNVTPVINQSEVANIITGIKVNQPKPTLLKPSGFILDFVGENNTAEKSVMDLGKAMAPPVHAGSDLPVSQTGEKATTVNLFPSLSSVRSFNEDRMREYFSNDVLSVEIQQTNGLKTEMTTAGNTHFPAREIFATYHSDVPLKINSRPFENENDVTSMFSSVKATPEQNPVLGQGKPEHVIDTEPRINAEPKILENKSVSKQGTIDLPTAKGSTEPMEKVSVDPQRVISSAVPEKISPRIPHVSINGEAQMTKESVVVPDIQRLPQNESSNRQTHADTGQSEVSVKSLDRENNAGETTSGDLLKGGDQFDDLPNTGFLAAKGQSIGLKDPTLISHDGNQSVPVEFRQVLIERLTHQLELQIKNNITEMKIALQPESLGAISLKLKMQDGKLNAQIDVHNPEVRSALSVSLPQIQAELTQRGIEVQRINISSFGETFGNSPKQSQQMKTKHSLKDEEADDMSEPIQVVKSLGYNTMEVVI